MDNTDPKSLELRNIYKEGHSNGYGRETAEKRFEVLRGHKFSSVLDVGSGPCFLQKWLSLNRPEVEYSAVDIRPEALALCNCPTYEAIPLDKTYDLVCLFGTVTYNIDGDELKNKSILKTLLREAKQVCRSILIFTVFKEKTRSELRIFLQDRFVYFSELELRNLLTSLGIIQFDIAEYDGLDKNEYFVTCKVD